MSSIQSGNFTFTTTSIDGVIIVDVKSYGDSRGSFMETYKQPDFAAGGIDVDFVQDNQSSSTKGVLRGLHFQIEHPQSKLVRVVSGAVYDVAVDLRRGSPTYLQWTGVVLSAESKEMLYIPKGFAHGFLTLTDDVEVLYKVDVGYAPESDRSIRFDDPQIERDFAVPIELVDECKDRDAPLSTDFEEFLGLRLDAFRRVDHHYRAVDRH